jgi:membrane protease YdiL (CAAX protease family)
MAAPAVLAFVLVAWLLGVIVVVLTRVTVPDRGAVPRSVSGHSHEGGSPSYRSGNGHSDAREQQGVRDAPRSQDRIASPSGEGLSTGLLFANTVLTHGSILLVLGVTILFSGVSETHLGLDPTAVDSVAVWAGVIAGFGLYVVDEVLSIGMRHVGFVPADILRSALAPASLRGWSLLLLGILPLVSVAEELLFRGALIGATLGLGIAPPLVLLSSSVLFGFAHGLQGVGGVVVAGVLGLGLGIVFLWTESLIVVVIAHYVVNTLEFVVHEGIDLED